MSVTTHAVYDAASGGAEVSRHPSLDLAMEAASRLGGSKAGYVVGAIKSTLPVVKRTPEISRTASPAANPATSISDMPLAKPGHQHQPAAPRASVAPEPEGPGLFD